ncbi:hypothetical protein GW819_04025 [Candidatus Gracilibacteria bacterium]|nr:hypothetical protein [Candidatus Gracilibacteria bacterium]PIQ11577.1 MAG: hypothetical protein COW68_02355 [Candidatus Gracilibacteria bacterium CG18_big_fil_WC_8_21_14_2_50_38_16]PIQ40966.1 MAG: hypothetical protein COW06_04560 [Candidatus Gracilibacteria bacterium CG12_big_fil_rev_8_21_14_0_65_38_15]
MNTPLCCYAIVQEIGTIPPSSLRNGKIGIPDDVASNDEKYYKLYLTDTHPEGFMVSNLRTFSVAKVQKIMNAKEGDLQWRILN